MHMLQAKKEQLEVYSIATTDCAMHYILDESLSL